MASEERVPMTREGYERLKADLDRMANFEMIEVTRRIASARELGDLSESSEVGDLFQITPDDTRIDGVQLAANDSPDDPAPVRDPAPKIPADRPETSSERTSYLR